MTEERKAPLHGQPVRLPQIECLDMDGRKIEDGEHCGCWHVYVPCCNCGLDPMEGANARVCVASKFEPREDLPSEAAQDRIRKAYADSEAGRTVDRGDFSEWMKGDG